MFKHKYTIRALWLALALLPLPAFAADACPGADAAAHAAREAGLRWKKMLDAREDDSDSDLSASDRQAIGAYKQALGAALDARLACSGEKTDPATLQRTLAAGLGWGKPSQFLRIDTQRRATPRPLMLVRLDFGIPCGDDNLLAGYAWERQRGWQRVLDWQSGDYKDISGAYGDGFSFAALPGGQVVVAYGTPWCTSNWSGFHAAVIAPADGAAAQRVLFQSETYYFRGDGVGVRLKEIPGGFELRARVSSLDPAVLVRTGIYRYRVHGDTVQRVQPAAVHGRDFVDEWLNVDDALARAWSDPAAADALVQARQGLREQCDALFRFGPLRACAGGKNRYQAEIELDDTSASEQPRDWTPHYWYALFRQERHGFTMLGLGKTPDAACTGPDLLAGRRDH